MVCCRWGGPTENGPAAAISPAGPLTVTVITNYDEKLERKERTRPTGLEETVNILLTLIACFGLVRPCDLRR